MLEMCVRSFYIKFDDKSAKIIIKMLVFLFFCGLIKYDSNEHRNVIRYCARKLRE